MDFLNPCCSFNVFELIIVQWASIYCLNLLKHALVYTLAFQLSYCHKSSYLLIFNSFNACSIDWWLCLKMSLSWCIINIQKYYGYTFFYHTLFPQNVSIETMDRRPFNLVLKCFKFSIFVKWYHQKCEFNVLGEFLKNQN